MNVADEYVDAMHRYWKTEEKLDNELRNIFGVGERQYWWERIGVDPVDWDGCSIEFTDASDQLVPTQEQMQAIWALGFNVIRIDYKNPEKHTASHGMTGDWWRVEGYPEGQCGCGPDQKRTSP